MRTLTKSMRRMENSKQAVSKKDLTSKEIQGIIKTCAAQNVIEFNFGALHIKFSPTAQTSHPGPLPHLPVADVTEEQHIQQTQATLSRDEANLRLDRLSQMFIEDPAQAEELLGDEDLDDDGPDTDE